MTTILWWLLQNTITIAVLVAIVTLLGSRLHLRPAFEHALWLVVLIKFVTPPLIAWPWTARDVAELLAFRGSQEPMPAPNQHRASEAAAGARTALDAAPTTQSEQVALQSSVGRESPPHDGGDAEIAARLADLAVALEQESLGGPSDAPAVPWTAPHGTIYAIPREVHEPRSAFEMVRSAARYVADRAGSEWVLRFVFGVWLAGGMTAAAGQLRRIGRHWRLVCTTRVAPAHLTEEVRRLAAAIGVRPIPALLAREIASPMLWCVGSLRLLWPESLAGRDDVLRCRGAIAHELAHVRRRDHWVAWLETVAGVFWWWNPLFWYVRRRLFETSEIACDALALSVLPDGRRAYAEVFLELSSIARAWAPAPVLGMSTGARRTFERRFAMMLSERVRSRISRAGFLVVGSLALITLPSWSLGQALLPDGLGSASASSDGAAGSASQPADEASTQVHDIAKSSAEPATPTAESDPLPNVPAPQRERDPRRGDTLDARVEKLEAKLEAILAELKSLRETTGPRQHSSGARSGSLDSGRAAHPAQSGRPEMATSPDGKMVAVVMRDGSITLADAETGKQLRNFNIGPAPDGVTFSPDGRMLNVRSDGKVLDLDLSTGAVVRQSIAGESSGGAGPGSVGESRKAEFRVFVLQYADAGEVQATLQEMELRDLKISSLSRTNTIIVAGPANELATIEALIQKLDVPADRETGPHRSELDPTQVPPGAAAPPTQRGTPATSAPVSGIQLDLVNLGTAIIDARGALRLAQAHHERISKATNNPPELLETAEVNLETARQKLDLLDVVAAAAMDGARADVAVAIEESRRAIQLHEKGFVTQSEVQRSQHRIVAAESKVRLLESILAKIAPTPPKGRP